MCGIAGFYGSGSQEVLEKMTDAVSYRGPDDRGFFLQDNVGLGHRRLSIIDTSAAGHQPLSTADNDIWVAFNGEIYNHEKLRTMLTGSYSFAGTSDTEVLAYLYRERGVAAFALLEGMFAIALYDRRSNKLFLVRDRMGEKPLYWTMVGTTLIFGSEQKSILEHPLYTKDLNVAALHQFLSFEYVPTPHSLFAGIQRLPPASFLSFSGSAVKVETYWSLPDTFLSQEETNESSALEAFDSLLSGAVKGCLVSDVPLGVFLSGGIDSSAIAYYAQKHSATPIDTFSIGFTEPSFDESSYARTVAKHLGTRHHEKIFSVDELVQCVEEVVGKMDEPLADPSLLPTYALSKFAREHVTVALGGDGGDELLAGYDTFKAERYARAFMYLPKAMQEMLRSGIQHLPTSFSNMSVDFKLKKFMSGFDGPEHYRHLRWLGAFSPLEKKSLFTKGLLARTEAQSEYADADQYFDPALDRDEQIALLYQRTYLPDDILTKVDRASMQTSLEVRAPFLNHHLVAFLNGLPQAYKIRGGTTKYLLKRLLKGKLPTLIIDRKKKGFGIPLAHWLTHELRPLRDALLSRDAVEYRGLFEYEHIARLLTEHDERRVDHRKKIWTLMVLEMWFRAWMPTYQFS